MLGVVVSEVVEKKKDLAVGEHLGTHFDFLHESEYFGFGVVAHHFFGVEGHFVGEVVLEHGEQSGLGLAEHVNALGVDSAVEGLQMVADLGVVQDLGVQRQQVQLQQPT